MIKHMNITQLAAALGVSRQSVYNKQATGELTQGHPEDVALEYAKSLESEAARIRLLVKTFTANGDG